MINFLKNRNNQENVLKECQADNEKLKKFNNILDFAKSVMDEIEYFQKYRRVDITEMKYHPLVDVIRVLGRNLQSKYLSYLLFSKGESELPDIEYRNIMFSDNVLLSPDGKTFSDLCIQLDIEKEIHLCRDLILPWPWERSRLINCMATIGEGRSRGKWEQDFSNHNVKLWLPLGIAWVSSGNHSIATGIIQGEGVIKPTYIFDISPIYEHVFCDGLYYRRKYDNSIISEVTNVEFAAIFEIGRVMIENSISF
jgi:hypothetical protein